MISSINNRTIRFDLASVMDSTKLADYLRCERLFLLRNVLGLHSEFAEIDLIFGAAMHKALELCPDPKAIANLNSLKELIGDMEFAFLSEYRKHIPETDDHLYIKNPAKATQIIHSYIRYMAEYGPGIKKVLGVEIPFNVRIGDIEVHGTIDLIYEGEDGVIYIRDYKTAGAKYDFELESFMIRYQFSIYQIAVVALIGDTRDVTIEVVSLYVKGKHEIGRTLIPRTLKYAESAMKEIERHLSNFDRDLRELREIVERDEPVDQHAPFPIFPRRDTGCTAYMKMCPFAFTCTKGLNPLIWRNQLPAGFTRTLWDPRIKERVEI